MVRFLLDSGAHTIYMKHASNLVGENKFKFYDSKEFYSFMDNYAEFIKKNNEYIDTFVTLDAINNPKKTFLIQEYFEKEHNLRPLPVVHCGADPKYVGKYIDKGYDYIGIGGLAQGANREEYIHWITDIFQTYICDNNGYPKIKTHGFAVTSFDLLLNFPWYSVDSTTWLNGSKFGYVFIPKKKNGKFIFDEQGISLFISDRSSYKKYEGKHLDNLSKQEQNIVLEYLESIGLDIEKVKSNSTYSCLINLNYFNEIEKGMGNFKDKQLVIKKEKGFFR